MNEEVSVLTTSPKREITSSVMKIVALVTMTLDHCGYIIIAPLARQDNPWLGVGITLLYYLFRTLGRTAFPLYAFMIAEGSRYTKNIYVYMGRLAAFAILSEVPFDLAFKKTVWDISYQNVFFTLLLGLVACWAARLLEEKGKYVLFSAPVVAVMAVVAWLLETDYGWYGVLLVWLCYITKKCTPRIRALVLTLGLLLIASPWEIFMDGAQGERLFSCAMQFFGSLISFAFIFRYTGKKGTMKMNKYFFYAYYPAHLAVFALLAYFLFK